MSQKTFVDSLSGPKFAMNACPQGSSLRLAEVRPIEFRGQIIPAFLLGIMSASVLSTWLFNRSEGSLLPLALFHAAVNTTGAGYVFRMFTGSDLTRLWWIFVVLWMAAAVLSVLLVPEMTAMPSDSRLMRLGQQKMCDAGGGRQQPEHR